MIRIRRLVADLDRWVAWVETGALVILVVLLTAVTFAQVITRYVLNNPLIWSEEAARYLFIWVSMIGAALAIREGRHFGFEILTRRIPGLRPILGPFVTIVMTAFVLVLFKSGIDETRLASLQYAMTLPVRMTWAYLALPVGAGLMLFHIAVHVIRAPTIHFLTIRETPE